ncbi:N-6 DNA methylase [Brachybacterium sp. Marseille-Q7125]|uniref:N-6 DNA methylase n=1 Tax=Brachybacterium sp. Marseille-Q7125 TaxID=2932815 RepID=UPI001FF16E00
MLATHSHLKPTRHTIEANIGASSPAYAQDSAYLESLYRRLREDPTIRLKRELWARLLRSALGTGISDSDDLFIDHTLLVLEAMAIGHAVMEIPLAEAVRDIPRFIEGAEFDNAGIHGVMEAGFFDWVLAAGPDGEKFIARLIRRVDVFDWSDVEHDVLKVLYESIINSDTRKGLGEYYTPDWLAEGIVEKAISEPLIQKALDPSCGSGTFIFHAVRRIADAGEAEGWVNRAIVDHVQTHVFGLDIHPVSIVLARITFLLALGERLSRDRGDVWVPVHLGDSIQWFQPAGGETDTIRIDTRGDDLTVSDHAAGGTLFEIAHVLAFPLSTIDDAGTFDRLVADLTELAKTHTERHANRPDPSRILRKYAIPDGADAEALRETFNLLADLNSEGRDSIWGYFVRNQVRPPLAVHAEPTSRCPDWQPSVGRLPVHDREHARAVPPVQPGPQPLAR